MDRPLTQQATAASLALLTEAKASQATRLPRLREDLVLSAAPQSHTGKQGWVIYDPLRHRFIEVDQATFEILTLWRQYTTQNELLKAVSRKLGSYIDPKEIDQLLAFMNANSLTTGGQGEDWQHLHKLAAHRQHGVLMTLVHNYLFFKIPITNPQSFLQKIKPLVDPFFRRSTHVAIILVGLLGLYLAAKQWDEFISEARGLATIGGLASFGVILFIVKAFHELGHACCAVRYGCRVPSMGLAFMMMAPLLYTDVTDAWRLKERRKRIAIDSAGVCVELALACVATFVWVFLPDGLPRHIAFLIATTSWLMSIAVNLNPFMRFDGYYIFSDLIKIPNLQSRAFAFGVWQLRETLFGLRVPCPEVLPARIRITLIAYAWSVWVYRFFLFMGIAAVVYTFLFKLLGVLLFLFEIGYFIVRPIVGELRKWWAMRISILRSRRTYATFGICGLLVGLAILPWSTQVTVPAVLEAGKISKVFPPRSSRVKEVRVVQGAHVVRGQVLVQLAQPDLDQEQRTMGAKRDAIRLRLNRLSADRDDRGDKLVLESELSSLTSRLAGLAIEQSELEVRAPQDGVVAELNTGLHAGRWIAAKEQIAMVVDSGTLKVRGYLGEGGLWRVENGATGTFIPEVPMVETMSVIVTSIAAGAVNAIDIPELATPSGGRIEAQADNRQRLIPSSAQYLIAMTVTGAFTGLPASVRGTVQLTGRPESFFASVYRRILKVLVRESGA